MELEFRNKAGDFLFSIAGKSARELYPILYSHPEFKRTEKELSKKGYFVNKKFVVLECIAKETFGLKVGDLTIVLKRGGYVKITNDFFPSFLR
jgi:hypothetical protein